MALKYDWDVVIPALEKAQNILYYAKGDCRNTRAMDFLDDCIDNMNTWIANAKPREEEPVINSRKPIKSFRDTSTEDTSNDYGFHWKGDFIHDKDDFHWYFGDYTNGNTGIEPYSSYMQAVKETEDSIRDAFTEDEIPDPEDYAYQLVDFAIETLPDPGKFIKEYEGFVKSSRKPIKSDSDWHARNDYQNKEIYREAFASLVKDSDAQDFDNSPYGTVHYPGFYRVLVDGTYETEFSAETDEEAIQKFKDYFAESRGINNSKKPIKSSLEDRLVPYLEEFEEGYADALSSTDEMGPEVRLDTFYEIFKSDYNLSDDDINKLKDSVEGIWKESKEM